MPRFSDRPPGSVWWLEAPAIYLLSLMSSYAVRLILEANGAGRMTLVTCHITLTGAGVLLASGYIWPTSANTSSRLFTHLARLSVLLYAALYIATVISFTL